MSDGQNKRMGTGVGEIRAFEVIRSIVGYHLDTHGVNLSNISVP